MLTCMHCILTSKVARVPRIHMKSWNGIELSKQNGQRLFADDIARGQVASTPCNQKIYEYLFTVTGVKKIKWYLSLMRCHFQPRVTKGHPWLEIAPGKKKKPLNCLHQPAKKKPEAPIYLWLWPRRLFGSPAIVITLLGICGIFTTFEFNGKIFLFFFSFQNATFVPWVLPERPQKKKTFHHQEASQGVFN